MNWRDLLKMFGPMIIAKLVPHGDALAPAIIHGVEEAEAIKGATGPEKLQHVVAMAVDAAKIAQATGAKIDPAEIETAAASAISAVVSVVNIVQRAQATRPAA